MRIRSLASTLIPTLTLAATAATAFADDAAITAPLFSSLDRTAQGSHAGVAMSLGFLDQGVISRVDLDGAHVAPGGFGVYGALAVSKTFLEERPNDVTAPAVNDATALSNAELGGLYQRRLSPELELTSHVGIALPTASNDGGVLTNVLSAGLRPRDLALAMPDTTWLRFGVAPTFQRGRVFVRGDLGLDIGLDNRPASSRQTIAPIGHASVGVGYAAPQFAASAELATVFGTGDLADDAERFSHFATVAAEYRGAGAVVPNVAIATGLDDARRGELIAITAGVKAGF